MVIYVLFLRASDSDQPASQLIDDGTSANLWDLMVSKP